MSTQKFATQTYKKMALVGYVGLLIYMPLWLIVISPSDGLSPALSLALFTLPLLLPAKGILQGNPYTFAWSNFIVLIYFLHSLTTLWVLPHERILAAIELLFASTMFYGATYYAKFRGQELGLRIKKLKDEDTY